MEFSQLVTASIVVTVALPCAAIFLTIAALGAVLRGRLPRAGRLATAVGLCVAGAVAASLIVSGDAAAMQM